MLLYLDNLNVATVCQKPGFIWWDSFEVITSNIKFVTLTTGQLSTFVIICMRSVNNAGGKLQKRKSYLEN